MNSNWRRDYPVLVMEAQTLGALGVIRSLGRAGYPVHSCAPMQDALGFESNYSFEHAVSPEYRSTNFIDWVSQYVRKNKIKAIIPSEAFLLAIRGDFREFSPLLPYSENEQIVYSGMSKVDQVLKLTQGALADRTSANIPPFLVLDDASGIPSAEILKGLGFPLYVKLDGLYAKGRAQSYTCKVSSLKDAESCLADAASGYRKILVEGHVPGRGVGAFFLLWQKEILAQFMHIRLHEVPHTGGVSSYRKSWWHEAVRADALEKLMAFEWQGVAMMEYRWDEVNDAYYFMEMNGRFWGSLHLALRAGVDFPTLLLDVFHGRRLIKSIAPPKNVSCRHTFPGDLMYVRSRLKDPSIKWRSKMWSLIEFIVIGLDPRVGSDLWYPGDAKIYWREFINFIRSSYVQLFKRRQVSESPASIRR